MKLSLIIPVKNDAAGLETCLQSIKKSAVDGIEYEVLVVDNGSEDDTISIARKHGTTFLLAPDATVAALRNLGAKKSTGEVLAFIDADCTVDIDWFDSLKPYLSDESVICFGNPPTIPNKATWVQSCWYQIRKKTSPDTSAFEIEWLESMNMFVRREAFWKVGGFDESMITCEDYDLCMRLRSLGSIICDSQIVAIHHGEADTPARFYAKERWRGSSNFQSLRKNGFALSELPSVLFPFIHVLVAVLAVVTLALVLTGAFPLSLWLLGVVLWQTPLLLLGLKKSDSAHRWQHAFGIGFLLNLYFLARGLSLFTGASWGEPVAVAGHNSQWQPQTAALIHRLPSR